MRLLDKCLRGKLIKRPKSRDHRDGTYHVLLSPAPPSEDLDSGDLIATKK